jgi:thiamine biosynthesis lipoprotein
VAAALLDVSGDLLAIGAPPGAAGWPVDIVDPRRPGAILASTSLRDGALATSGVSVSRVRLSGVERGHVLDLAQGAPVERRLQATVTAATGMMADILSTAMLGSGGSWAGVRQRWVVANG